MVARSARNKTPRRSKCPVMRDAAGKFVMQCASYAAHLIDALGQAAGLPLGVAPVVAATGLALGAHRHQLAGIAAKIIGTLNPSHPWAKATPKVKQLMRQASLELSRLHRLRRGCGLELTVFEEEDACLRLVAQVGRSDKCLNQRYAVPHSGAGRSFKRGRPFATKNVAKSPYCQKTPKPSGVTVPAVNSLVAVHIVDPHGEASTGLGTLTFTAERHVKFGSRAKRILAQYAEQLSRLAD